MRNSLRSSYVYLDALFQELHGPSFYNDYLQNWIVLEVVRILVLACI